MARSSPITLTSLIDASAVGSWNPPCHVEPVAGVYSSNANNTNIFPVQLQEFPTLAPDVKHQGEVIAELEAIEEEMRRARVAASALLREVEAMIGGTVLLEETAA